MKSSTEINIDPIAVAESRLQELEVARRRATVEEQTARGALGEAIAVADAAAAARARVRLADARASADELADALPVARRRLAEARESAVQQGLAAARVRAEALTETRLRAAGRIDAALRELAVAHAEHRGTTAELAMTLDEAGSSPLAQALARREGAALSRAIWACAPDVARDLGISRPTVAAHARPLRESESETLGRTAP